ncbi:unnamed protein product, partial [Adineta steineri]
MAESKGSYEDGIQNIDINALLSNGLEGLKRNVSEDHSKIIYALQAVDGNEDGELKNRVIEASKKTKDAHIALIPYKKGSEHWAGIFIKFKPQMQIETMEIIDSAEKSNTDINSLQTEIDDIFNDVYIRWTTAGKHSDPVKSAEVTVESLLQTAAKALGISEQYMGIMGSHEQPNNNDESTSASLKDDCKSSVSSASINRSSKHHLLKQISDNEIEPTISQVKSSLSPLTCENNELPSESRKCCRRVIENINNFKYEEIQIDLETLRTSKEAGQGQRYFEQAKRVFNISLYSLLEATKTQTIMLGSKLEFDAIKALVDNLKRMENAKRYMSEYTDKLDIIDSCAQEVKGLIERRMKHYLSSVRGVSNLGNFYDADERLKHIQAVKDLLGIYCTECISQEIDTLCDDQEKILYNVVVKRYIEKDISEYTLNPPKDIFARLEKVKETDERYVKALGDLNIGIMSKFRKELDDAIKKKPPNPDNIHIRRFEAAIKHLPDDLQTGLEIEFKHCKEQITKDIQQNDKELESICNSKDIKHMKELIQKYREVDGMQSYADKVQEYVRQQTK